MNRRLSRIDRLLLKEGEMERIMKMEGLRLVILEDEEAHFQLMKRAIGKDLPHALVYHFTDAAAYIQRLNEIHPDVILVDYLMPGMNGIEFLRVLNERSIHTPVVMITGQGDETIAVQAMKSGAWDYLSKSPDFFKLLPSTIEKVIRERKLKDSLRAVERRFQDLAENTSDWIWEIDTEGRYLYSNPAVEKILGYRPSEIIGRRLDELFPERKEEIRKTAFFQSISTGMPVTGLVSRLMHREGRQVIIETNAVPVFGGTGRVIGYRGIDRDITERKLVEDKLRASEERLRLVSSKLLKSQEEERRRIARELHDSIGSSLSAIKMSLENARSRFGRGTATSESLEIPISWTQHAIEEARRLMMNLRPSLLDDLGIIATMNWFCRQYQAIYPSIYVEKNISIEEGEIEEPLKIVIFRIIQEAFHNIGKYSQAELVELSLQKEKGMIEVIIEDNGVGFDPSRVSVGKNGDKGGLGLAGMKERAELSGGSFFIESLPGSGTIVRASWPCAS